MEANVFAAACLRQRQGSGQRGSFRGNQSWIQRYELASILKGHRGCVNTIQWSPDARLLCSGSDDRVLRLWRFENGRPAGEAPAVSSLATLHRHNIFDAQLTRCQGRIVSCGADGCVCLTEVASASPAVQRVLYEPEAGHYLASKIAFARHLGPDVFLVTFGDGRVRMFDLREAEHRVAVEANGLGLTGIDVRPTDGVSLAIGGNDPFLRLYDLRALSYARENAAAAVSAQTPVVSLHTSARHLDARPQRALGRFGDVGISGVAWSCGGRLLLANYRGSDVVLFDMAAASALRGAPEGGSGEVEPRSGDVISAPAFRDEYQLPSERVHLNAIRSFEGRTNEQTCAKEVRFLCGEAAVATGGDCGNLFIWEAATAKLLRKLPADRCVVNCVAPHPELPLVCTSGIDSEIKVWDLGDARARCSSPPRRAPTAPEEALLSRDWDRRRRESPANATAAEAAERLVAAERAKQRGNGLVREADWVQALACYREALQELHFLAPNTEVQAERDALATGCHLNCAWCHLNLREFALAVEESSKALECDGGSVKARFRRATALGELREFDRAFEDVEAALAAEPENAELAGLRARLEKQRREHQRRERGIYRRLFARASSSDR